MWGVAWMLWSSDGILSEPGNGARWEDGFLDQWVGEWWAQNSNDVVPRVRTGWVNDHQLLNIQVLESEGRTSYYLGWDRERGGYTAHRIVIRQGRATESGGVGVRRDDRLCVQWGPEDETYFSKGEQPYSWLIAQCTRSANGQLIQVASASLTRVPPHERPIGQWKLFGAEAPGPRWRRAG